MSYRGYIASPETREKMRQAKLLRPTRYWIGRKKSAEHRAKIATTLKGVRFSEERRIKHRQALLASPKVQAMLERMRNGQHLGRGFKGRHTEETKLKISAAKKGWKPTEEHRLKMRQNASRHWLGKKNLKITGEKNWKWKRDRSGIGLSARKTPDYRVWRTSVFQRDNWTCQTCGVRGCVLEAHHVKSFAKFPELRLDVNNGVTLCLPCHAIADKHRANFLK